jgi:hypothetical protein
MAEADRTPVAEVGGITPVLRVESIEASLAYYTGKLGFKIDWQTPCFVSVSRGRSCIFCRRAIKGTLVPGFGLASMMPACSLTNIAAPARKFGTCLPTIPGLTKCKLKISMATCFVSDPTRCPANR